MQNGKKKCQKSKNGRMTGAGTVITSEYGRSHHVFRNSVCNVFELDDERIAEGGNHQAHRK